MQRSLSGCHLQKKDIILALWAGLPIMAIY